MPPGRGRHHCFCAPMICTSARAQRLKAAQRSAGDLRFRATPDDDPGHLPPPQPAGPEHLLMTDSAAVRVQTFLARTQRLLHPIPYTLQPVPRFVCLIQVVDC